jgi:hypothetical protein
MEHLTNCYDDEGRLVCCCPIGAGEDVARDEKISRAEAHRLVEQHSLNLMSVVMGAMR